MCFPYLRGKQFELIALRELVALPLDANRVVPIIEPVKRNLKSIETALKALKNIDVAIQLIVNPEHGEMLGKTDDILTFIRMQRQLGLDNIIPTFLIKSDSDIEFVKEVTASEGYADNGYALIHLSSVRRIDEISTYTKATNCLYNSLHINHIFALRRKFERKAILGDYFRKQRVNADYANDVDESFSSDCFFYDSEGFAAFADYQTIGSDWIEGGMLPKAVVIHLTYRYPTEEEIRVYHFVSDTNDDTLDVAGKFYEAVSKLVDFVDAHSFDSMAIRTFKDLHAREAFPGLGTIKKLSIMHHIQLIQESL